MSKKEQAAHINQQLQIGLIATYKAMLAFKKYKQSPVIISRDGKIIAVPPEEMPPARNAV
ncbi:hypothetical protein [Hymenobacter arizonensis]|uniref:Uncharacterized protein n=1 Tax=Hymenobacter arizonensis TaxID=1227077 RepID=A0A1I6B003_HYMAR|nr:hypothetical protein [Hymenobacter arizonensis]SFQ74288.1 hypothetical protein SAMN04515668_4112 [Hymenobacter arizonensis]